MIEIFVEKYLKTKTKCYTSCKNASSDICRQCSSKSFCTSAQYDLKATMSKYDPIDLSADSVALRSD